MELNICKKAQEEFKIHVEMHPTLFFEDYSVLQIVFHVMEIRNAKTILFSRSGLKDYKDKFKNRLIRKTIRLINPKVNIRQITMAETAPYVYVLNKLGAELVDQMESFFKKSSAIKVLLNVVGGSSVPHFYKSCLSIELPKLLLFRALASDLRARYSDILVCPSNPMDELESLFPEELRSSNYPMSKLLCFFVRSSFFMKILYFSLASAVLPLFQFFRNAINGRIEKNKKKYLATMPVAWGVVPDGEENIVGSVKKYYDDMYLYGEYFSPGQILHVFGEININPKSLRDKYKRGMAEKGIPYAEREKCRVNMKLFGMTLNVTRLLFRGALLIGRPTWLSFVMFQSNLKAIYHFLIKNYEIENYDYKVELVKNDYNPGHIIASEVAQACGRKRVGVAHSASSYDCPQNCFVKFDRYVIFGNYQVKIFNPFWNNVHLARIGRESIDSAVKATRNTDKIKEQLYELYPKRKWNITILLPGIVEVCLVEQWNKMYEALRKVKDVDLDCNIFLRFRRLNLIKNHDHSRRFLDLPEMDPRIIVDQENFTTHDLMAVSDLVITGNSSFGINEAIVINKKVFTFSYARSQHLYFPDYGQDFILYEPGDVLRVMQGLENNFEGFDCDWDRLYSDLDYYHDGQNSERLSKLMYDLAAL